MGGWTVLAIIIIVYVTLAPVRPHHVGESPNHPITHVSP